ncbi:YdeI family protein [Microlunatus sp. GCM10028923]|uniref:YdeI/OmpD-associated family protein n=1 Tax=Microlunatus sp. GCM10028923 TaxID=3273400 RepID=UPI00361F6F2E
MADLDVLTVPDPVAWRDWLDRHHTDTAGVWLVLAKKGVTDPTSVTYELALLEALCYGWIDGHTKSRDAATYLQRYTPRRPKSPWSLSNTERVRILTEEGRLRPAGLAEVERAQADGRWEMALAGAPELSVPEDLRAALAAQPRAAEMFSILTKENRFAVLHRLEQAGADRAERLAEFTAMLGRGETCYPQRRRLKGS